MLGDHRSADRVADPLTDLRIDSRIGAWFCLLTRFSGFRAFGLSGFLQNSNRRAWSKKIVSFWLLKIVKIVSFLTSVYSTTLNLIISPFQFGFLPNCSTTTALLYSTHSILSLLESFPSVCGAFLDLKKAFDSVPHAPLINLLQSLHFPPFLINWLHVLLSFKSISICHYQLPHLLPQTCLIWHPPKLCSPHITSTSIPPSLNMLFSHKPSRLPSFAPLVLAGSPIELVSTFKYLGVLLTPSLSWSTHISSICSRARKILGIIFRHFYKSSSPITLIRLYTCLVRPILEYSAPVWNPSSQSLIHSLESIQLFALKIASRFRPSLIPTLSASHSISPLTNQSNHLKVLTLFKFIHHLSHYPSPFLKYLPRTPYPIRSYHPQNLSPLSVKSASLAKSFFPPPFFCGMPSRLTSTNLPLSPSSQKTLLTTCIN